MQTFIMSDSVTVNMIYYEYLTNYSVYSQITICWLIT